MLNSNKKGFTLIELMLAMSLFISILVISTTAFVGINRTFSKGMTRKQLSEGVQRTVEEMTRSIREGGRLDVGTTTTVDGDIYDHACNQSTCYVWKAKGVNNRLIKTVGKEPTMTDGANEIVDARFKIDFIQIEPLSGNTGTNKLYRIYGVMRTVDDEAFVYDIDYADYIATKDPSKISCKGTAQAGASYACALEKFEFIVNTKVGP